MTLQLAPMHWLVRLTSALVLGLATVFYLLSLWHWPFIIAAGSMTGLIALIWLAWIPIAYDIRQGELSVRFRLFTLHYGRIVSVSPVEVPMTRWAGLFRNGGLFAISGIFWTRQLGTVRAHVTTTAPSDLLLVQTQKYKVIISPADAQQAAKALAP